MPVIARSSTSKTIAIVGGGLAGAKAAEGARQTGFDGRIVLVGAEAHYPYERPALSKAVLRGEAQAASTAVHDDGWYAEHDIDVVTAQSVVELDVANRQLRLAGGDTVTFDTAVLATGSSPRPLPVPGAELAGVHYLRTLDDAHGLRQALGAGGRVGVIGAGWLGSEVAASARQTGADVVLIAPSATPLQRVLGARIGEVFKHAHADEGVRLRLGVGVTELRGGNRVAEVVLADGSVEAVDTVVVGIGALPRVERAVAAGLVVANGVVADEHLATSAPHVYVAGDVASAYHPHYERHLRVEHWANALNQGLTAGRNAAGAHETYERLPYFYSDQYDLGLEYIGDAHPDDSVVIRGDVADHKFIAFWQRDGRVTAAMNVNVWDVVEDLRGIITDGRLLDPNLLGDAGVALSELRAAATPRPR